MANYSSLKAAIVAAIKTNGNQEITGQVLQDVLTSMVSVIGANYTFAGVATPSTNPGTPDQNVVYMASQAGMYTNFGNIELPAGISLLMWNGAWTVQTFFALDEEPTSGSNNLVKSGGVFKRLLAHIKAQDSLDYNNIQNVESISSLFESGKILKSDGTVGTFNGFSVSSLIAGGNFYIYGEFNTLEPVGFCNVAYYTNDGDFIYTLNVNEGLNSIYVPNNYKVRISCLTNKVSTFKKGNMDTLSFDGNVNYNGKNIPRANSIYEAFGNEFVKTGLELDGDISHTTTGSVNGVLNYDGTVTEGNTDMRVFEIHNTNQQNKQLFIKALLNSQFAPSFANIAIFKESDNSLVLQTRLEGYQIIGFSANYYVKIMQFSNSQDIGYYSSFATCPISQPVNQKIEGVKKDVVTLSAKYELIKF